MSSPTSQADIVNSDMSRAQRTPALTPMTPHPPPDGAKGSRFGPRFVATVETCEQLITIAVLALRYLPCQLYHELG